MLSNLLVLFLTENAVMWSVAEPAWVLHLPGALVLHLAGRPLGAHRACGGGVWGVSWLELRRWFLLSFLRMSGHGLHQVSWMHLWSNLRPSGGTNIQILVNPVRIVLGTEPSRGVKICRRRLHGTQFQ